MAEDENLELNQLEESAADSAGESDAGAEGVAHDAAGSGDGGAGGGGNGDGNGDGANGDDGRRMIPTDTDLDAVYDIPVQVSAVLGKATMKVNQLLKLGRGAVVELDRKVGEAIDIYVNNRLVARGEVVVVDERLGVTMTEIIKADRG